MGCTDRDSNFRRTIYRADKDSWWCAWGEESYEANVKYGDKLAEYLSTKCGLAPGWKWRIVVKEGWYIATRARVLSAGERRMIDNPGPGQVAQAEKILDEMGY